MKIIKSILVSLLFVPLFVFAQNQTVLPKAGLTPESLFYFIDKLGEALRDFLTFNPEAKARLQVAYAAERVAEIKIILETKGVDAKGLEVAKARLEANTAKAVNIVEQEKQKGKDVSKLAGEVADNFHIQRKAAKQAFDDAKQEFFTKKRELHNQLLAAIEAGDTALQEQVRAQLVQIEAAKDEAEAKKDATIATLETEKDRLQDELEEKKRQEDETRDAAERAEEKQKKAEEKQQELEEKLEEEVEAQQKAEKAIREAEKEKQEVIDEAAEEGVALPANAFAEFNSLLAQAKNALVAGNLIEAKNLAKRAEKSLDQLEKTIEELEKKQEKKEQAEDAPEDVDGENTSGLSNLKSQFSVIEQELIGAKNSKSFLSETHYERIKNDLNTLKKQGYSASEIERLHNIAIELNPHIADQNKPTSSASLAPTPCISSKPQLVADITDFSKIQKITAPGSLSSEGPKGHAFIWTNSQRVPIYAPTDAILESGSYSRDKEDSPNQYNLTFDIKGSCFKFRFDHIDEPVESIRSVLPTTPKVADSRGTSATKVIEFKAGDLIGYTKGNVPSGNWDFGLYDMSKEGALAQHGSYGLHRHSVCWPDYYSTDKYKKLLEGPKLVCSQSSSTPLPSPSTSTFVNKDPVLKNLGVRFEPWDKNTNRAGAFIFLPAENKLFLEYGVEVASSEGGTKILPTFEYRTAADADVFAAMDGIVTNIAYKEGTQDYSILIQPELNSEWTLGHDHVSNLKVSKGDVVKAGNILGKAGTLGGELGRTEIMFWGPGVSSTRVNTYCPFKYFAPELLSEYQQKVLRHMKDWEEFKGNANLYNEEKHIFPGCAYETLLD